MLYCVIVINHSSKLTQYIHTAPSYHSAGQPNPNKSKKEERKKGRKKERKILILALIPYTIPYLIFPFPALSGRR